MKRILLSLLLVNSTLLFAQPPIEGGRQGQSSMATLKSNYSPPSPNATAIAAVSNLPVDLSTGQINFNVPLYALTYNDITVPISLSYNYSGFKPNDHPSWAGLGWTLNAGGAVVRIKKGEADEAILYGPNYGNCTDAYSFGYLTSARIGTIRELNFYGDKNNPSYTSGGIENFSGPVYGSFENAVNYSQFTTSYSCGTGMENPVDLEPDEFVFNFNGYQGTFIYNIDAGLYNNVPITPVVLSKSSDKFRIECEFGEDLYNGYGSYIKRYIKKITFYMKDGYIYEFGGNYGDANMELTFDLPTYKFGGATFVPDPVTGVWKPSGYSMDKGNSSYVSTWYLSKITSPQGAVVDFTYKLNGYYASLYPNLRLEQTFPATAANPSDTLSNYNTYAVGVNSTAYLSEIKAGGTTIEFTSMKPAAKLTTVADLNPYDPEFAALGLNPTDTVSAFAMMLPDYIKKLGIADMYGLQSINGQPVVMTSIPVFYELAYPYMTEQIRRRYAAAQVNQINYIPNFFHFFQQLTGIKVRENGNLKLGYDFNYNSVRSYCLNDYYMDFLYQSPSRTLQGFNAVHNIVHYMFQPFTSLTGSGPITYPDTFLKRYPVYSGPTYVFGESKTGRLELKNIKKYGADSTQFLPFYSFEYSMPSAFANSPKVEYGTRCIDHWGYLNRLDEKDFFFDNSINDYIDTTAIDLYDPQLATNYYNSREPMTGSDNPAEIGALSRITYPTGGRTEITYEWNDYKKRVAYNPSLTQIELVTESSNIRAGGIRVKSIAQYDDYNATPVVKNYFYTSTYPSGTVSSGVLNSGKPVYYKYGATNVYREHQNPKYFSSVSLPDYVRLSSQSEFPNTFEGDYIKYSKVIEQNAGDQSYKIYKFSNSDTGPDYLDKVSNFTQVNFSNNGYPFDIYYSRSEARGNLLQEDFYKANGTLTKTISYQYNSDPLRFDDKPYHYIKKNTQVLANIAVPKDVNSPMELKCYVSRYPSYNNSLRSKTEFDFVSGAPVPVATISTYSYDRYRNLTEETIQNSNNEIYSVSHKFANSYLVPSSPGNYNFVSPVDSTTTDVYSKSLHNLIQKKLYGLPIEKKTSVTKNGATYVTSAEMYEYDLSLPLLKSVAKMELNAPVTNYVSPIVSPNNPNSGTLVRDGRYQDGITAYTYNGLNVKYINGIRDNERKVAIIRDNHSQSVVALASNASIADIAYCNFDGTYNANASDLNNKGNWSFGLVIATTLKSGGLSGRCFTLTSGQISKTGLTVGKKYRLSMWVKIGSGSMGATNDNANTWLTFNTGRTYNNTWVYHECIFTAQTSSLSVNGYADIDELRLYPEEATMETYSYNMHGMTFKGDAFNHMEFYTYDNFGRLLLVVNEEGNIIRKHEYGNLTTE